MALAGRVAVRVCLEPQCFLLPWSLCRRPCDSPGSFPSGATLPAVVPFMAGAAHLLLCKERLFCTCLPLWPSCGSRASCVPGVGLCVLWDLLVGLRDVREGEQELGSPAGHCF